MKTELVREELLRQREDLSIFETTPGQEFVYRPGELLVNAEDCALVQARLDEIGAELIDKGSDMVACYRIPAGIDIPSLVTELRATDGDRTPRLGPNTVLFGHPRFLGWPGDDPEPADALIDPPQGKSLPGTGTTIAIIDTGLDAEARQNPWMRNVQADDPADIDLTADAFPADGFLDTQAGHAAFIAGLIRQAAPGANVRVIKALDTGGVTDELIVAKAIDRARETGAQIINLSLGGYTPGDLPPVAIVDALERLDPSVVVVAAAGNLKQVRPMWPAALKRVIAVGAVDDSGNPADFTNFGWWVDCCAPGVDLHSIYVSGRENPQADPQPDVFEGYATWSGTSFSTAMVTAAVAVEMGNGGTARDASHRLLEQSGAARLPGLGVLVS